MNCTQINLGDYAKGKNLDFESRTTGIKMRALTGLDSCLQRQEKICFIIPANVIAMSQPFIEEYFGWAIFRLGAKAFRENISFQNEGRYDINSDIDWLLEKQYNVK